MKASAAPRKRRPKKAARRPSGRRKLAAGRKTHPTRSRYLRHKKRAEDVKRQLTWSQVEILAAMVILAVYQSNVAYDVILVISRGGLAPGCLLAQGFGNKNVIPVAIDRYGKGVGESHRKPHILFFPPAHVLKGKKVLVVDDVWDFGHSYAAVLRELRRCNPALVHTAALHFKPNRNKYPGMKPTFYAEETGDWIVYPWESFPERVLSTMVVYFSNRSGKSEVPMRPARKGRASVRRKAA